MDIFLLLLSVLCLGDAASASVRLFMERSPSRPSLARFSVSTPYQQHFVVPASLSGRRICTTSPPDIQQPPSSTCTLSPPLTNGIRSDFRRAVKRPRSCCCCCLNGFRGSWEVFSPFHFCLVLFRRLMLKCEDRVRLWEKDLNGRFRPSETSRDCHEET